MPRFMRLLLLALASLILSFGALAAPASADQVDRILQDCQDGQLDRDYSAKDINRAKRDIPTDIDEYTDCRDTLNRARLDSANSPSGARSGGESDGSAGAGASSTGGGAAPGGIDGRRSSLINPLTDEEKRAVAEATESGPDDGVAVAGSEIRPDSAGLVPASSEGGVPATVIFVLALLGLGAIGAAVTRFRRDGLLRRGA